MDKRKTDVKRHTRRTQNGRTTVKRHQRELRKRNKLKKSVKRLRQIGMESSANIRETEGKPLRLTDKEIREEYGVDPPHVNRGDSVDDYLRPSIKNNVMTPIETIILQKMVKQSDGDIQLLDNSLTYEENLDIVQTYYPEWSGYVDDYIHGREDMMFKAKNIHESRSARAKAIDKSSSNIATVTGDELMMDEEVLDNPKILSQIDVEGVDTRTENTKAHHVLQ